MILSKKYRETVEQITLSAPLKEKILSAAEQPKEKKPPLRYIRQAAGLAACIALTVTGVSLSRQLRGTQVVQPVTPPPAVQTAAPAITPSPETPTVTPRRRSGLSRNRCRPCRRKAAQPFFSPQALHCPQQDLWQSRQARQNRLPPMRSFLLPARRILLPRAARSFRISVRMMRGWRRCVRRLDMLFRFPGTCRKGM